MPPPPGTRSPASGYATSASYSSQYSSSVISSLICLVKTEVSMISISGSGYTPLAYNRKPTGAGGTPADWIIPADGGGHGPPYESM